MGNMALARKSLSVTLKSSFSVRSMPVYMSLIRVARRMVFASSGGLGKSPIISASIFEDGQRPCPQPQADLSSSTSRDASLAVSLRVARASSFTHWQKSRPNGKSPSSSSIARAA